MDRIQMNGTEYEKLNLGVYLVLLRYFHILPSTYTKSSYCSLSMMTDCASGSRERIKVGKVR